MEELYSDTKESSDNSVGDVNIRLNGSSHGWIQIKVACAKVINGALIKHC